MTEDFQEQEQSRHLRAEIAQLRAANRELQDELAERTRVEAELRNSEDETRALFRAMNDYIFVLDRSGRYVKVAATSPRGILPTEEWAGKRVVQVFPPEQAGAIVTYIQMALDTRETIKVEYRSEVQDQAAWFSATIAPMDDDRVIWVARDISERKQMEEALRRYTERMETLNEVDRAILAATAPQDIARVVLARLRQLVPCERASVLLFDWEKGYGRFIAADADGERGPAPDTAMPLARFPVAQTLQRTLAPLYLEDVSAGSEYQEMLEQMNEREVRSALFVPLVVEKRLVGGLNLMALQSSAFTDEHQQIARQVADQLALALQQAELREELQQHAEDLETRVAERTSELQAANKELEAFSYSVSHDLRAPLRAISSFTNLLTEEYGQELDEVARRYVELVRDNAAEMGKLIESLLTFSRTSREELKKERVNPAVLVQQVWDTLSPEREGRQVEITVGDLPECQADPHLLRQVYANLIGNALKFTRRCAVARIEVASTSVVGEGQVTGEPASPVPSLVTRPSSPVTFYVRDNGVGFDMQYAHKLFGVFQRLHHQEDYEGSGVGLAIVQRILHRHGGRIWAESEKDRGTTFYFTLSRGRDDPGSSG